jgi:hypothetical protein
MKITKAARMGESEVKLNNVLEEDAKWLSDNGFELTEISTFHGGCYVVGGWGIK